MPNDLSANPNFGVPDADALDRAFAGDAPAEDRTRVDEWLAARTHAGQIVQQFIADSNTLEHAAFHSVVTERDAADSFQRLQEKLGVAQLPPLPLPSSPLPFTSVPSSPSSLLSSPRRRRSSSRPVAYLAAGLTLAALTFIAGWQVSARRVTADISGHVSAYTTANGQRATITLPDGSTAELNVGSRLEVPANYASGNRTIQLKGEALFTVRPNVKAPFLVKAGTSTTQVLGTSFIVRQYATDTATTIAVRDGKVTVASVVLTAGEQATVSTTGASRVERVSAGRFTFASGVLTLDDVSLPDAITELNRWYDADIRLGDRRLITRNIGGRFSVGSLAECAEFLELAFNVKVVRQGRMLTLYPRS